jgi:ligand-binding sensor domain-containing protein
MPTGRRSQQIWISSGHAGSVAGLLLWLIGWVCPAFAQTWQVSNWHVDDGLPYGDVTAIAQTPDGYLWVGTPMGVARFDGVRFTVFRANEAPGLADSRIVSLLAAKDGTLWVGTLGGTLSRWVGGQFETLATPLPVDQDLQRAPGSWSWGNESHLEEDEQGGIWWQIAGKGTARFYQGQWRLFAESDGLPANIWQLIGNRKGAVWAELDGKLFWFDGERWQPAAAPTAGGFHPSFACGAGRIVGGLQLRHGDASPPDRQAQVAGVLDP